MQNSKNTPHPHQFIRKPKRKPSHKHNQLHPTKCQPTQQQAKQIQQQQYNIIIKQQQNNPHFNNKHQSQVVLDLKNQLSFLKQQMAKIVHSKLQPTHNQQNASKVKLLDYYFPKKNPKLSTSSKQSLHNDKNTQFIISGQENGRQSIQRDIIKKIKSKQRLKFSKIKKSQKITLISPTKKKHLHIQTQPIPQQHHQQPTSSQHTIIITPTVQKSPQPTLQFSSDIHKLSQKHKQNLQMKLKYIILEQQNIDINAIGTTTAKPKSQQISKEILLTTSTSNSPLHNNKQQQKLPIYEVKITRMKKQLKQQDQQIESLKQIVKQKDQLLAKLQQDLKNVKQQLVYQQQIKQQKEVQCLGFEKKVMQVIQVKNQLETRFKQSCQDLKKLTNQNRTIRESVVIVENKLKNKQTEILKLQKINKNQLTEFNQLSLNTNYIILELKKQISTKQFHYQTEIAKLSNKIIQETKLNRKTNNNNNNSQKQSSTNQTTLSTLKFPKQQQSNLSLPSPRHNSNISSKQKQLLSIIKMHQKSIQNYQKDLTFLENQCKNLHQFKLLAKKLQIVLKDTSEMLVNQQLIGINLKYEKLLIKSGNLIK